TAAAAPLLARSMPSTHNVPTNPSLSSAQRGDGFKDLAYAALVVPSLVAIS
ncbi:hypothetical protein OOU_Y34scaffold00709g16, partial [Pyricularia oryzae Y34]